MIVLHKARRAAGTALIAGLTFGAAPPAGAFELPEWTIANQRDHPLVGTIVGGSGAPVSESALGAAILDADHVAVGEIHTNADHHRVQAAIVDALAAGGRRPAIVFEMISESLGPALKTFLDGKPKTAEGLGKILQWESRGWPDWTIYRPIAEAALRHGLAMKAGDMDRDRIRAIGTKGRAALTPAQIVRYGLDQPFAPEAERSLTDILDKGHCGLLPQAAIAPMLTVQRARDGALADAMIEAVSAGQKSDGTVLIAGAGHVRKDWAVPAIVKQRTPDRTVVSIALVEVSAGDEAISDYSEEPGGGFLYDFVIFTPRHVRDDPCIGLKERLKSKAPAKKDP